MHNLINFLLKNISWFVFILLELICFYFVFTENSYQKSVYLNSSNEIVGRVYSVSSGVSSYFGLKEQNQDLLQRNAQLQNEVFRLRDQLMTLSPDTLKTMAFISDSLNRSQKSNYDIIIAHVTNNSVYQAQNFISINKGSNDGVVEDMGVISEQGIVGVVRAVSNNFSVVQPILNPISRFSCKVLNSNAFGTLVWEGGDPRYAYLTEYPKYDRFEKGDTIVTSGFSGIFPEGIFVGIVEDYKSQTDDNFYSLKVKLATDFSTLKDVLLIKSKIKEEQTDLEKKVKNVKK